MVSLEIQVQEQIWSNLKFAIILIASLTPFVILFLIIRYNRIIKRLKSNQQEHRKLIEKRIEVYDRIGPKLNDLLCFYTYTGNWKELTPMYILNLKKELDKEVNASGPFFPEELNQKYLDLMYVCFVAISGWEHDEKIKSLYDLRKEQVPEWNEEWIRFFDPKNVVEAIRLKERYDALMACFRKELNA